LGYWSVTQSCGLNATYNGLNNAYNPKLVFQTATTSVNPAYPANTTYYDIYSCAPQGTTLESCYNPGATTACCGADDWNVSPYLTAQTSQSKNQNTDWTTSSPINPSPLSTLSWMKSGCPTAYVYPWDDHSSTFNCNTSDAAQHNNVLMDFEVVFCPGGLTGALTLMP